MKRIAISILAGVVGLAALGVFGMGGAAEAATTLTRTTTFTYDPVSGQVTQSVVEPSNPTFRVQTDFGYDTFGNWTSKQVSGAGIVTRTDGATYETNGRFALTLTNPLNHVTTQGFSNAFGTLTSVTDPNAVVATTTLDTWGRTTLVTNSDGTKVSYQYQFCAGVAGGTATCPANGAYRIYATPLAADGTTQIGAISITYFDSLEREIAKHVEGFDAAQPTRVTTLYDALGRVLKTSRPYFVVSATARWTTFTYDALDRVTLETRPDTSTIQHAYHGLSVTDTNQLSQVQTTVKNSRGEIVSVTDNLTHTTTFAYDPFGNLTTTTDSASNVISNTYDLYGRKTAMSDPDMGSWSYGYDVLGQLTSQTNAKSQTVTLAYDKLGRMTSRTEPDLSSTWTYDTQTKGIGKLATTSSANFQRTVSYDVKGRPTQSVVIADGTTYTTTSTYNAQGKIGTVTYPSGFGLTYTFNARGYLTTVTDTASSLAYWTATGYDAEGHLTQATFGNGIQTTKAYNLDTGRIDTIKAGPSDSVQNLTYTFNTLGNLNQMVDAVTQTTDTLAYDGLNRLNAVTTTNPSIALSGSKSVVYDGIGNITSKSDVGTYTYDPSRVHAVASIAPGATGTVTASYTYDANGNLLTGRGKTVTWSSFDMVSQVSRRYR